MNAKCTPRHVALVDGLSAQHAQLRDRLAQEGCSPVVFEDSSEVLALLCQGRKFDLLFIIEDETLAWRRLVTVCGALGLPTLVLARIPDSGEAMAWLEEFPATPFSDFALVNCGNSELRHRMHRLLHHGEMHRIQTARDKELIFGNYEFNRNHGTVLHRGCEIILQPRQFKLALELFCNMGQVLDRNQLWDMLWAKPSPIKKARALDVCVANVRKKLGLFPDNEFSLRSVYGRGYQLLAVTPRKAATPELASAVRAPIGWTANSSPPQDQVSSSPN